MVLQGDVNMTFKQDQAIYDAQSTESFPAHTEAETEIIRDAVSNDSIGGPTRVSLKPDPKLEVCKLETSIDSNRPSQNNGSTMKNKFIKISKRKRMKSTNKESKKK